VKGSLCISNWLSECLLLSRKHTSDFAPTPGKDEAITVKDCNQCGKCCTNYGGSGLSASVGEIDWWETYRPEISRYVSGGKIWISPVTGKQMEKCPWLQKLPNQKKYSCHIYHDRPDDCRYYPVDIGQMIRDDCEMLESQDLTDQKKAQSTLDKLMADSRPPLQQ
jgi:Fe-S-cluster containining protein